MIRPQCIASCVSISRPLIPNGHNVMLINSVAPTKLINFLTPRHPFSGNGLSNMLKVSVIGPTQYIGSPNLLPQVRCGHTDLRCPDYTEYRRAYTDEPDSKCVDTVTNRRLYQYVITSMGISMTLIHTKTILSTLGEYLGPPDTSLASAQVEVDLRTIPEGKNVTIKWIGKPVFVKHRTEKEINRERATPLSALRDPQTDEERATRPEWLIMLGVCTHLGCVPIANSGDFPGGFFCPCHGSHYDGAGRVRKGPAPLNLPIPDHEFKDEHTLIIGQAIK